MLRPSELVKLLEEDQSLLAFKFGSKGHLIWPLVRFQVILEILNEQNDLGNARSESKVSLYQIVKTLVQSFSKPPTSIRNKSILFFNSGITNVLNQEGRYFNRITDYFYFEIENQAALIEDTADKHLRWPRVHKNVYAHLPLRLKSAISRKMYKPKLNLDDSLIIKELLESIGFKIGRLLQEKTWKRIRDIIERNCLEFQSSIQTYVEFFKAKRPKIIFVEDGSYGSRSYIIVAAHSLKIPVAELQHGFVNEEHHAYNLGQGLLNTKVVKDYYPDYLLMYGDFWSSAVKILGQKIVIGNPFLSEKLAALKPKVADNQILFLSSGITFQETSAFLSRLIPYAINKGFTLTLRPHPLEMKQANEKYSALIKQGLIIDKESDLYESISRSKMIVGETSTALFEAMAVKVPVFLFNSSYTRTYITEGIKIPKITIENIESIFNPYSFDMNDLSGYFWANSWKANFGEFIKRYIE